MNRQEHLLTIAAEECAEVAQRLSKALRFGLGEIQIEQKIDNRGRVLVEFYDLCSVLRMAGLFGGPDDSIRIQHTQMLLKREKVERFLEYSRQQGTLIDEAQDAADRTS